jgi:hypothetical protein
MASTTMNARKRDGAMMLPMPLRSAIAAQPIAQFARVQ